MTCRPPVASRILIRSKDGHARVHSRVAATPFGIPCFPLAILLQPLSTVDVATACGGPIVVPDLHPNTQLVMNECTVTVPAAFMHVRDNIEELGKVADNTDLLFLKGLLDSPVVTSLVKVSECTASISTSKRTAARDRSVSCGP